MSNATSTTMPMTCAASRPSLASPPLSRPFLLSSVMSASVGGEEVLVDHPVHVQDVAFLPRVQPRAGPARGAHAPLHIGEILVVLFGDLAPIAVVPVLEEPRLCASCVFGAGGAPFQDPRVLYRPMRVVTVGPDREENGPAGEDRPDTVGEPEKVAGPLHGPGRRAG